MKFCKTILTETAALPPCACRLLARRKNGAALTGREIAEVSGLDRSLVNRLSMRQSWGNTGLDTVARFSFACGVNHLARKRHIEYLKTGDFEHVRTAPPRLKGLLVKLMKLTAESL